MSYQSRNPATGEVLRNYPETVWEEAKRALEEMQSVFLEWKTRPMAERASVFLRMALLFRERKSSYAALITEEMGKPIAQAEAEIEKCAWGCEFYAAHAGDYLCHEVIHTDASKSYVRYDPLGVILGIMPWNFPFWQAMRFSIPTLLAGNGVMLKPAPSTPECALAIEFLYEEAGLPKGLFDAVFASNETAARLMALPPVSGVSLTGSSRAGSEVAAEAGRALKKCVLELGGSDPFIVLADADIAAILPSAVRARMFNAGQSCIAAKRFIVEEACYDEFCTRMVEAVTDLKVGDPMDRSHDLGPMAREDLRANLERQVGASISQGARVLLRGGVRAGQGYYYDPTVLDDVRPGMTVFEEEVFGPVVSLIRAKNEDDAITLANRTAYGLGATLCTRDADRAEKLAERIEAGSVFINGMVKSDPRLPFGGIKRSGFGRELSAAGIREFTNMKTVWIK